MLIIGISGRKASGKSSTAEFLRSHSAVFWPDRRVRVAGFADTLKEIAIAMYGLPRDACYGDDDAKNVTVEHLGVTVRSVLQRLGMAMREIWPDVWIAKAMAVAAAYNPGVQIFADVRLPNEVDAIQEAGGYVLRLLRKPHDDAHESETALDGYTRFGGAGFDATIDNTSCDEATRNSIVLRELVRLGAIVQ